MITPRRNDTGWFCTDGQHIPHISRLGDTCYMCERPAVIHMITEEYNDKNYVAFALGRTLLCQAHYEYWQTVLGLAELVGV